jgi:protein phosphatase 2C-like protein
MRSLPWRIAMASSIGTAHIAAGQPCQDAHCHFETVDAAGEPVLVLAASDGAGSAERAEIGAMLACDTFVRLVAAYLEQGGTVEAIGRPLAERWVGGLLYRLELQTRQTGAPMRDYACTLLAAVIGAKSAAFLQIGDGAMVIADGGGWRHVFWPQHGEFANTTTFITSDGAAQAMDFEARRLPVGEVALFTDGLESLVLHKATRTVHAPFFDSMFPSVRKSMASGVDDALSRALGDYLSGPRLNERTDDDKTLILASRKRA